jgi:succinate dehydrogenase / fumarate reductase flavoprotein subunit
MPLPEGADAAARAEIARLLESSGPEKVADIRRELQEQMEVNASVMRDAAGLKAMQAIIPELRARYLRISLQDTGVRYNTDLTEAIELGYLLDVADAIVAGALAREESRGAHYREDFPKRDDGRFLVHTLAWKDVGGVRLGYKPVSITRFQPQERKY